jgi:putative transcriptional regulator
MNRIRLRLRECMDLYEARTGIRLGYPELAAATGLSVATVQSLGSRDAYNTTLRVVERLCLALGVSPSELVEWHGTALELNLDGD